MKRDQLPRCGTSAYRASLEARHARHLAHLAAGEPLRDDCLVCDEMLPYTERLEKWQKKYGHPPRAPGEGS